MLDTENYSEPEKVIDSGCHSVDLDSIKVSLDEKGIKYREIPIEYGLALVLLRPPAKEHWVQDRL